MREPEITVFAHGPLGTAALASMFSRTSPILRDAYRGLSFFVGGKPGFSSPENQGMTYRFVTMLPAQVVLNVGALSVADMAMAIVATGNQTDIPRWSVQSLARTAVSSGRFKRKLAAVCANTGGTTSCFLPARPVPQPGIPVLRKISLWLARHRAV